MKLDALIEEVAQEVVLEKLEGYDVEGLVRGMVYAAVTDLDLDSLISDALKDALGPYVSSGMDAAIDDAARSLAVEVAMDWTRKGGLRS